LATLAAELDGVAELTPLVTLLRAATVQLDPSASLVEPAGI
jgi:hypothetical protein